MEVSRWSRRWLAWVSGKAGLSAAGRWVVDAQVCELAALDERIAAVEEQLRSVALDDHLIGALLEVRGIGLITAVMLRAEVGRFERFGSGKQLSRFCGLSPRNASSGGRSADAGLVRAANPRLRAVLIEAAHRLIRLEPRWRSLAQRLRRRGKAGSVVAAAVANRWMRWLYHRMVAQAA